MKPPIIWLTRFLAFLLCAFVGAFLGRGFHFAMLAAAAVCAYTFVIRTMGAWAGAANNAERDCREAERRFQAGPEKI